MSPARRWPIAAATLAALAWAAVVLWRYQPVQSPEPIVGVALVVAWLAAVTLACLGGGRLVWRLAAPAPPLSLATAVIELALGAGLLAVIAGVLGAVSWLRPLPLLLALAALATAGGVELSREARGARATLPWALRLPAVLVAVAAVLTLLTAVTPSPFYDQLHYHLAFPFQWLRHGRIEVYPREAYSFFPATNGLLYCYALAALGAGAAQVVHWWLGAVTIGGVAALASALRGPRAGWWAAALLATTPSAMLLATWAAADLAVLAFAIAALTMLLLASRDARLAGSPVWWLLVGALAGLAAGCKYLAVLTVAAPLALAVMVMRVPAGSVRRLPRVLLAGAGGALTLGPWLLRNLLATGNPVYPFLSALFPAAGRIGAAAAAGEVASRIPGVGWARPGLAQIVSLTTFSPVGDAGAIGPAYLALLPLAAWALWKGRRSFAKVLAVFWLGATAGWIAGPPTGRYLLPAVAVLAALAGAGLQRVLGRSPRTVRAWLTALLVAVLAWSAIGGTTPVELARLSCTLGRGSVDEVMARYASYWPAVRAVDRELPADAKLLLVGESRTMYLERDVVVDDPFVTPLLVTLAESSPTAAAIAAELRRQGVTHVLINRHEAARMAALNHRSDYLAPLSPAGRSRLEEFLGRCLRPVATAGPVELLALQECGP
jgi:hypothetical protein